MRVNFWPWAPLLCYTVVTCHPCMLWHDSLSLLMQVHWRVNEQMQNECMQKGKQAEACAYFKKASKNFTLEPKGIRLLKSEVYSSIILLPDSVYVFVSVNHLHGRLYKEFSLKDFSSQWPRVCEQGNGWLHPAGHQLNSRQKAQSENVWHALFF